VHRPKDVQNNYGMPERVSSAHLRPSGPAFVTVTLFLQCDFLATVQDRRMPKGLERQFYGKIDIYDN
jgi:hypothetical protein